MLIIKGLIGGLFQVVIFAAMLLIPAGLVPGGTWFWKRAIYFLIGYGIFTEILIVWLCIVAPAGMEARFKKAPKDVKRPKEDKILTPLIAIFFVMIFIVIPLDVFYLHLLTKPNLIWSVIGVIFIVFGLLTNAGSIYANAFITKTIQDQTDQGQKVVDTGVYSIVRHPYYTSLFFIFGGVAIWLESWVGLIAILPMLVVMILRIRVEERYLIKTLPEYTDYMKKVKYRLLPFIW